MTEPAPSVDPPSVDSPSVDPASADTASADTASADTASADTASADPDCVFCAIVAQTLPSYQVYADEQAVAFLDRAPWHRGHTLVVPRRHVPDVVSGDSALAEIARAVDAVARLLKHRLAADGVNLVTSAGAVAGQEVFHLHVHVVPRYADEPGIGRLVNPASAPEGELASVQRQLEAGG